jgi:hypothetical protein
MSAMTVSGADRVANRAENREVAAANCVLGMKLFLLHNQ